MKKYVNWFWYSINKRNNEENWTRVQVKENSRRSISWPIKDKKQAGGNSMLSFNHWKKIIDKISYYVQWK
jgi:hypothetical protein